MVEKLHPTMPTNDGKVLMAEVRDIRPILTWFNSFSALQKPEDNSIYITANEKEIIFYLKEMSRAVEIELALKKEYFEKYTFSPPSLYQAAIICGDLVDFASKIKYLRDGKAILYLGADSYKRLAFTIIGQNYSYGMKLLQYNGAGFIAAAKEVQLEFNLTPGLLNLFSKALNDPSLFESFMVVKLNLASHKFKMNIHTSIEDVKFRVQLEEDLYKPKINTSSLFPCAYKVRHVFSLFQSASLCEKKSENSRIMILSDGILCVMITNGSHSFKIICKPRDPNNPIE